MTAELCHGRPSEFWWTGDPGNRLAIAICGRCMGCPDDDPQPYGVIRRGVAYSDSGRPLPLCAACGGPNAGYTGGDPALKVCAGCAVPQVPIPNVRRARNRWMHAMSVRRISVRDIAADAGVTPSTVEKILTRERRTTRLESPQLQESAA